MELNNLRKKIDSIDEKVVRLLNLRASITLDIASHKRKSGKSLYSPEREHQVLTKLALINRGPLTQAGIEAIYREIMSNSFAISGALKIAYLGPEASFTNLAAIKRFGSQVQYIGCNSISEIFLEVERDNADYGVVPVENSIEGVVTHTLDMFVDSELKVCSQIMLDVSHNLLADCGPKDINKVYSNPQVFGQCRLWLQKNLAAAEQIEVSSTTKAAQIVSGEKNSACIASSLAAKVYKLRIIASNIEDSPHNKTRFLVIGKTYVPLTGNDKTSIMFSIKDRIGALHDMLVPFKKHHINLTKIESRPSKKKVWDYYFYVDFKGHCEQPNVQKALIELEDKCKFLKVLGSYPVGE